MTRPETIQPPQLIARRMPTAYEQIPVPEGLQSEHLEAWATAKAKADR